MLKNEWLLSVVTFLVSFGLSFLVNRDIQTALVTGLIALPAAFAGLIAVNIKRRRSQKRTLTALQMQIRQLETWKEQLHQYLWAVVAEHERLETQVNYRQNHLNSLSIQAAEKQRVKQQLTLDLMSIGEQKHKIEADLYHLEQQKEELDLAVRSLKAEHHKTETTLTIMRAEMRMLQEEILVQQGQREQLEELLDFLRSQLNEWQTEDIEIHEISYPPEELTASRPQELLKAADEHPSEDIDEEWAAFVAQLTYPELEVLKAIVQQDNPNPIIKNIAESNITMPEILIDAINERAMATIGDIIIEPGADSPVIAESEYLENVKKLLEIKAIK